MSYVRLLQIVKFWCYFEYIKRLWWSYFLPFLIRLKGVRLSRGVIFYGSPIISLSPKSTIEIGERAVICSVSEMTALGVNHPVILRTLKNNATIRIGRNTGISGASICAAELVDIGEECLIGANVMIVDTDFHPIRSEKRRYSGALLGVGIRPTIIENNVFIGAGSTVLKGVRIGVNSVIGAGSVVTKDIPPNSIAVGNPAKVIKQL